MSAPIGRMPIVLEPRAARLVPSRRGWHLVQGKRSVALASPLSMRSAAWVCGHVDVIDVSSARHEAQSVEPMLWELAATGAVLVCSDSSRGAFRESLDSLVLSDPGGLDSGDPLEWEIRSVRTRRTALAHLHPHWLQQPVSAVLVTRRAEFLSRIVAMIAAQTQPLELIIGTHGFEADDDEIAGLAPDVPLRTFPVPAEHTLGTALSDAASMARFDLITKFDDDDYYSPTHVQDLVAAMHYSAADLVGGPQAWVYVESEDTTVRRPFGGRTAKPESYGDWVAGGTILVGRTKAESVGYFSDLPRAVDQYIFGQVLKRGGRVYRNNGLGYLYVRAGDGHTYQVDSAKYFDRAVAQYPGLIREPELGTADFGTTDWRELPGGGFPRAVVPPTAHESLSRWPQDDSRWQEPMGSDLLDQLAAADHAVILGTAERAGLAAWRGEQLAESGGPAAAPSTADVSDVQGVIELAADRGRVWRAGPWQQAKEPESIVATMVTPGASPRRSSRPTGRVAARLRTEASHLRNAPPGLRAATVRERAALGWGAVRRRLRGTPRR